MNKLCSPPDLFETGFPGGCAEGGFAGGGMAACAGDTSVEHEEKPSWNLCFYTALAVAHSWCSLPVVQSFGLVFACLHAWENIRKVVVGLALDDSPILDNT